MKCLAQIFLNRERTCNLTDVPGSIYDKNRGPTFDTINGKKFYDDSVSRNLFIKKKLRQREPKHMRLSGTDGLRYRLNSIRDEILSEISAKILTS